jgi:hypothetical protein
MKKAMDKMNDRKTCKKIQHRMESPGAWLTPVILDT